MAIDIVPMLQQVLSEMRSLLSESDVQAGLPFQDGNVIADVSVIHAQWVQLSQDIEKQKMLLEGLEQDLLSMSPWGEYPIDKLLEQDRQGLQVRFWRASEELAELHGSEWADAYQAERVSSRNGYAYFTTTTPKNVPFLIEGAVEQKIAPSPLSTLIMLQTRSKDRLRQLQLRQADFALAHYREVEKELGIEEVWEPMSRKHRFVKRLRNIFK